MSEHPEHGNQTVSEAISTFLELAGDKGWFLTEGANDGSTWTVDYDEIERLKAEVQAAYDGQHLSETQELRHANAVLQRMLEAMPDKHMRFGVMNADGTVEEPEKCADWCYACKLDRLRADVEEWKSLEAEARGACIRLAEIHGHVGSILARFQAGQYNEALTLIQNHEQSDLGIT